MVVRHRNETEVRIEPGIPLHLKQQLPYQTYKWTVMGEGIGGAVLRQSDI